MIDKLTVDGDEYAITNLHVRSLEKIHNNTVRIKNRHIKFYAPDDYYAQHYNDNTIIIPAGADNVGLLVMSAQIDINKLKFAVTVNHTGWATAWFDRIAYATKPDDTENTAVYYVEGVDDDKKLILSEPLTEVKGGEGVIINTTMNGEDEKEVLFTGIPLQSEMGAEGKITNKLKVAPEDGEIEANKNYVLGIIGKGTADEAVGFVLYAGTTIDTDKAYLPLSAVSSSQSNPAKALSFYFGGETTDIGSVLPTADEDTPKVIYNMQGQRVQTMQRGGLYIVNGKKIINL